MTFARVLLEGWRQRKNVRMPLAEASHPLQTASARQNQVSHKVNENLCMFAKP
jgi:hypothetical protein